MSGLRMMSLCSGYEGLGMAVHAVTGAKLVAVSDIDKGANKILAHRFPDVPNLGDLKAIDWAAWAGTEVMTAGYPCQPFSHAGKREGTDDPRHIWPDIARGIAIVRPRMCFFENVRGHLSLGFDEVVRDLHLLGYDVQWVVMRAADVGAPHGRSRLFILAQDRNAPRLFGGGDRRGGLHRDSANGHHVSGAPQGVDVGQGPLGAEGARGDARREAGATVAGTQRAEPEHIYLAVDGGCGCARSRGVATDAVGERASGRRSSRVSSDGRRGAEAPERPDAMDGRHARPSTNASQQDSGSEPPRTRPVAPSAAGCDACRCVPPRVVVGAGDGPVRASGVHGDTADVGADGRGTRLRNAISGAACDGATPDDARRVGGDEAVELDGHGSQAAHGAGVPDESDRGPRRARPGRGATADAASHGRHEGRTEPARLVGRPDVAELGASPAADTYRDGLEGVGGLGTLGRYLDGRPRTREAVTDWGIYAPAINRWSRTLGRPAPAPTEPGAKGQPRLSPRFVEFMMGLPAGWVTDVPDLTRNEQLKALGNGVVPQQAAAALTFLLNAQEKAA